MYYYNLTLRNGDCYYIKDKEAINNFMQTIARNDNWRDFLLASNKIYDVEFGTKRTEMNTVMLLTSEIILVEYLTELCD